MQTIEYTTVDKTEWAPGAWHNEPDKKQWLDTEHMLPCLLVRNGSGSLCGYVGVTEEHPLFGANYDDVDADVHGGLTFSSLCQPHSSDGSKGICHTPDEDEPDHVWWFGFDCAHLGDLSPAYKPLFEDDATYRTQAYVEAQCKKLAAYLKEESTCGAKRK